MKHRLCKELNKPLVSSSAHIQIQPLPTDVSEETYLSGLLQFFMSNTMDPDVRGRKPDKFLSNMKVGRLGNYEKRYIRIAVEDNTPIGLLIALPKETGDIHILSLSVHPAYRQKGIGKSLLRKCEQDFSLHPLPKRLLIDVHSDNTPALNLYMKLGYTRKDSTY